MFFWSDEERRRRELDEPQETERGEEREVGPEDLEPIPEHDKGDINREAMEEAEEVRRRRKRGEEVPDDE